jgi:hypothetical protein
MIALCQTEQEKAEKILRLYLAAARNDEGEKMVLCNVDYPKMKLISQAVVEPEYGEDEEARPKRTGRKKDTTDWDQPSTA